MKYYEISAKNTEEIFKILKTNKNGLSSRVANEKLEENGLNIATDVKLKSWFYFFIDSFKDKFIFILIIPN